MSVGLRAKATDVDVRVSDVMQRYWTTFRKTGNSNDGELPKWPRFDPATRAHLEFSDAGHSRKRVCGGASATCSSSISEGRRRRNPGVPSV
jgi:carboxylesterase type B